MSYLAVVEIEKLGTMRLGVYGNFKSAAEHVEDAAERGFWRAQGEDVELYYPASKVTLGRVVYEDDGQDEQEDEVIEASLPETITVDTENDEPLTHIEQIASAILDMPTQAEDESLYMLSGQVTTAAISEAFGSPVPAADRDAAYVIIAQWESEEEDD